MTAVSNNGRLTSSQRATKPKADMEVTIRNAADNQRWYKTQDQKRTFFVQDSYRDEDDTLSHHQLSKELDVMMREWIQRNNREKEIPRKSILFLEVS
jgi:hypothetical protein